MKNIKKLSMSIAFLLLGSVAFCSKKPEQELMTREKIQSMLQFTALGLVRVNGPEDGALGTVRPWFLHCSGDLMGMWTHQNMELIPDGDGNFRAELGNGEVLELTLMEGMSDVYMLMVPDRIGFVRMGFYDYGAPHEIVLRSPVFDDPEDAAQSQTTLLFLAAKGRIETNLRQYPWEIVDGDPIMRPIRCRSLDADRDDPFDTVTPINAYPREGIFNQNSNGQNFRIDFVAGFPVPGNQHGVFVGLFSLAISSGSSTMIRYFVLRSDRSRNPNIVLRSDFSNSLLGFSVYTPCHHRMLQLPQAIAEMLREVMARHR